MPMDIFPRQKGRKKKRIVSPICLERYILACDVFSLSVKWWL